MQPGMSTVKSIFKNSLAAALFLFVHTIAPAQDYTTVIKTQALEMARAILSKDVNKVVEYLPPKLVEASGGKARVLTVRDSLNKFMQQFGAEVKKLLIGNPGKVISYKNELQCTLPQTTEVTFMENTVTIESTLIAISEDKGKHWYFVDTNIYRNNKLKEVLPNLSPDLVIPPMKQPQIKPATP